MCCASKKARSPRPPRSRHCAISRRRTRIHRQAIYAAFGKGVHTESIRDYPYLEAAHAAYSAHGAILEQIIEQGEALSRIHPQSVNTLRIPTVVLADGEVRLFHPTLRVGRGEASSTISAPAASAHSSTPRPVHLLRRRGQKGPPLRGPSGHRRAL